MSIERDYVALSDGLSTDSSATSVEENSDVETLTTVNFNLEATKNFWFGKRYFECAIAQDIFEQAGPHLSIYNLEAQFQVKIGSYAFDQNLNVLQGHSERHVGTLDSKQEAYQAFMTLVGKITRNGTVGEKRSLLQIIRPRVDLDTRALDLSETVAPNLDPPYEPDHEQISRSFGTGAPSQPEISQYTVALKENGDKHGVNATYREQRVKLDPPVFKSIVAFRGFTFEGIGRTKKAAKHEASKEACEFLRIPIL